MLTLTPELVAKAHRHVVDPGLSSGTVHLQDEDYAWWVDHILTGRRRSREFWVFAYGSLIWKPEFAAVEERIAHAYGWHRAFALKMTRWRGLTGTSWPDAGARSGWRVQGIAYRLPEDGLIEALGKLVAARDVCKTAVERASLDRARAAFYGELLPTIGLQCSQRDSSSESGRDNLKPHAFRGG